jgi:hypothetical protein
MRRVGRAFVVAFVVAAYLASVALATRRSAGSTRSALAYGDPATTFRLTGSTVTVSSTDPLVLGFVRGRELLLGCDGVPFCASTRTRDHRPGTIAAAWGARASSVSFHHVAVGFSSAELLLDVGRPVSPAYFVTLRVAVAAFTPGARRHMLGRYGPALAPAESIAQQILRNANLAVQVGLTFYPTLTNKLGSVSEFPPAQTIVTDVDGLCSRGSSAGSSCTTPNTATRVLYAATLAYVTNPDDAYVVGAGTASQMLELANIGLDHQLYTLRAKPGDQVGEFSSPYPN